MPNRGPKPSRHSEHRAWGYRPEAVGARGVLDRGLGYLAAHELDPCSPARMPNTWLAPENLPHRGLPKAMPPDDPLRRSAFRAALVGRRWVVAGITQPSCSRWSSVSGHAALGRSPIQKGGWESMVFHRGFGGSRRTSTADAVIIMRPARPQVLS